MIVRRTPDGLQLITQPDHAALARRIMERCAPLADRPRRELILHAIAEHDSGWAEDDASPRVDPATGDVLDFVTAPLGVRQGGWPRAVANLGDNPWAAALVAQHALTAYERYRPEPEWRSFFAELEKARAALLVESGLSLDELVDDYTFVRLGDLISLAFCTGWRDENAFAGYAVQLSGDRVAVEPDLFDGHEVAFEITARAIPRTTFESDEDLRAALAAATTVTLPGSVGAAITGTIAMR